MKNILTLALMLTFAKFSYSQQHSVSYDFLSFVHVPSSSWNSLSSMGIAYNYHHFLNGKTRATGGIRYDITNNTHNEGLMYYSYRRQFLKIPIGLEYFVWRNGKMSLLARGGMILEQNFMTTSTTYTKDGTGDLISSFKQTEIRTPINGQSWSIGAYGGVRFQPTKRLFFDIHYQHSFGKYALSPTKNTTLGILNVGIGFYL